MAEPQDTKDAILATAKRRIQNTKLNQAETLINALTDDDFTEALLNALNDYNATPPYTSLKFENIVGNDTIIHVVGYSVTVQILEYIVSSWTHLGLNLEIEDVVIEDKKDDYVTLHDFFFEKYVDMKEKFKLDYNKRARGIVYRTKEPLYRRGTNRFTSRIYTSRSGRLR